MLPLASQYQEFIQKHKIRIEDFFGDLQKLHFGEKSIVIIHNDRYLNFPEVIHSIALQGNLPVNEELVHYQLRPYFFGVYPAPSLGKGESYKEFFGPEVYQELSQILSNFLQFLNDQ